MINKIEKDHCYSKKPEVLYFNDKYIFIELENKDKKSILIKTIDSLFDEYKSENLYKNSTIHYILF